MFEYILFSTLWVTSINPELGRFKELKDCQYVAKVYIEDQYDKESAKTHMKNIHCIKVSK